MDEGVRGGAFEVPDNDFGGGFAVAALFVFFDFPDYFGKFVFGDAAVDVVLEDVDQFRAAFFDPHFGSGDAAAILHDEGIGQRVGGNIVLVVVGEMAAIGKVVEVSAGDDIAIGVSFVIAVASGGTLDVAGDGSGIGGANGPFGFAGNGRIDGNAIGITGGSRGDDDGGRAAAATAGSAALRHGPHHRRLDPRGRPPRRRHQREEGAGAAA